MTATAMHGDLERAVVDSVRERQSRFYGKYRGTVDDPDDSTAEDGKRLGRIRAKVPAVYGDTVVSPWASPCVPFAGKSHGLVLLPEQGDGVWIEFECGDPALPIWSGCWWADNEMPNAAGVKKRALVTTKGIEVVLDDDAPSITIKNPGGAEVTMDSSTVTIKLGSKKVEISKSSVSVNGGSLEVK